MNLAVVRMIAAAGVFAVPAEAAGQRDQSSGSAGDRAQISAILTRWEDAWNTHDMAAFASVFHERQRAAATRTDSQSQVPGRDEAAG